VGAAGPWPWPPYDGAMPDPRPDPDRDDAVLWQPATSAPGELYTVEGQIRAYGSLAQGLTNDDPRLAPYRRSMWRTGLVFVGLGIALAVVAGVVSALL
jgi:hypothetical protein